MVIQSRGDPEHQIHRLISPWDPLGIGYRCHAAALQVLLELPVGVGHGHSALHRGGEGMLPLHHSIDIFVPGKSGVHQHLPYPADGILTGFGRSTQKDILYFQDMFSHHDHLPEL